MLPSKGHCAKNESDSGVPKTNGPASIDKSSWGDPVAIAAMTHKFSPEERALRKRQVEQVEAFAADKEKQAEKLATAAGEDVTAEVRRYFDAAKRDDEARVETLFAEFIKRHPAYAGASGDKTLDSSYWAPVMEVSLAYASVVPTDPKSVQFFVDDTINSIPAGSIYFGGTDPGRGLITAFSKSHTGADPFFTLTQNALADERYLIYLRRMWGQDLYSDG